MSTNMKHFNLRMATNINARAFRGILELYQYLTEQTDLSTIPISSTRPLAARRWVNLTRDQRRTASRRLHIARPLALAAVLGA